MIFQKICFFQLEIDSWIFRNFTIYKLILSFNHVYVLQSVLGANCCCNLHSELTIPWCKSIAFFIFLDFVLFLTASEIDELTSLISMIWRLGWVKENISKSGVFQQGFPITNQTLVTTYWILVLISNSRAQGPTIQKGAFSEFYAEILQCVLNACKFEMSFVHQCDENVDIWFLK